MRYAVEAGHERYLVTRRTEIVPRVSTTGPKVGSWQISLKKSATADFCVVSIHNAGPYLARYR
jgi:hypothetical protein